MVQLCVLGVPGANTGWFMGQRRTPTVCLVLQEPRICCRHLTTTHARPATEAFTVLHLRLPVPRALTAHMRLRLEPPPAPCALLGSEVLYQNLTKKAIVIRANLGSTHTREIRRARCVPLEPLASTPCLPSAPPVRAFGPRPRQGRHHLHIVRLRVLTAR